MLLLIANVVKGQETFHNIYFFDDSTAIIHDIFATDSSYYFGAADANNSVNRVESLFGKIDLSGNLVSYVRNYDPSSNQHSYGSRTQLTPNNFGNLTFGFTNYDVEGRLRILEYSTDGVLVFDTLYTHFFNVDSFRFWKSNNA